MNILKKIKVKIIGESEFRATYSIYIPLKGTQIEKAKGMMKYYGLLNDFIVENNIELNGRPVVEITRWDIRTDSIEYNFCYPIKNRTL